MNNKINTHQYFDLKMDKKISMITENMPWDPMVNMKIHRNPPPRENSLDSCIDN